MSTESTSPKKRRPFVRIILLSLILILAIAGYLLYSNSNRLLSDALMNSFNANISSDVYELKFEKLRVNFFEGSISVMNVVLQPREKPLKTYPYINSSIRLTTKKVSLMNVQFVEFFRTKKLKLESVSITRPEIQIKVGGEEPVIFPFEPDSVKADTAKSVGQKKTIDSFRLDEFKLVDASFHVVNSAKQREFTIEGFNISLLDLLIRQRPDTDLLAFRHVDLSVGKFDGRLHKGGIRHIALSDINIGIDSLQIQKRPDTLTFKAGDFTTALKALDIQTADSLFHVAMQSFNFSYKDQSIKLSGLTFQPNISDSVMQAKYTFQHTRVAGTVGSLTFLHVNFDSLIYHRSLFIDEIVVESPDVSIFKDNTKPADKNKFPPYFGQQINSIPIPIQIKTVTVTKIHLENTERKRDSTYAKVQLNRGTAHIQNITNRSRKDPMSMTADAYLADKVHFDVRLDFSYIKQQFMMAGKLEKFNMADLNPVIMAYTPAKINAGIADEITFSGTMDWTQSSGSMTFLYHDLEVDLELQKQAKWKSSVIAFAANSLVASSNPGSDNLPPRIVALKATRDMNKGFINLVIKSLLNGVKETMVMSKENRKAYQDAKKKLKKEKGKS